MSVLAINDTINTVKLLCCDLVDINKHGALAPLKDYAETDGMKCVVVSTDEVIKPEGFMFDGSPYFSYELYKKYSGEEHNDVEVRISYRSKHIYLPKHTFDSAEGISDYVKDLATLHDIVNIRRVAYKKKGIKLEEFVWGGCLYLDTFGQVSVISDTKMFREPNFYTKSAILGGAVPKKTFFSHYSRASISPVLLPHDGEVCPICGESWNLQNVTDYFLLGEYDERKGYHHRCYKQKIDKEAREEFFKILSKVYNIKQDDLVAIPNEYYRSDTREDWFKVKTRDGEIKVGWRKRVIEITWLDSYKEFKEEFEDEDVTKKFRFISGVNAGITLKWGSGDKALYSPDEQENERYIHAWSTEKAVEYLQRAKRSIIRHKLK